MMFFSVLVVVQMLFLESFLECCFAWGGREGEEEFKYAEGLTGISVCIVCNLRYAGLWYGFLNFGERLCEELF